MFTGKWKQKKWHLESVDNFDTHNEERVGGEYDTHVTYWRQEVDENIEEST